VPRVGSPVARQVEDIHEKVTDLHKTAFIDEKDGGRKATQRENTDRILAALQNCAIAISKFGEVIAQDSQRRSSVVEELRELNASTDKRLRLVEESQKKLLDDTNSILGRIKKGA
jgi:hypothetical protein